MSYGPSCSETSPGTVVTNFLSSCANHARHSTERATSTCKLEDYRKFRLRSDCQWYDAKGCLFSQPVYRKNNGIIAARENGFLYSQYTSQFETDHRKTPAFKGSGNRRSVSDTLSGSSTRYGWTGYASRGTSTPVIRPAYEESQSSFSDLIHTLNSKGTLPAGQQQQQNWGNNVERQEYQCHFSDEANEQCANPTFSTAASIINSSSRLDLDSQFNFRMVKNNASSNHARQTTQTSDNTLRMMDPFGYKRPNFSQRKRPSQNLLSDNLKSHFDTLKRKANRFGWDHPREVSDFESAVVPTDTSTSMLDAGYANPVGSFPGPSLCSPSDIFLYDSTQPMYPTLKMTQTSTIDDDTASEIIGVDRCHLVLLPGDPEDPTAMSPQTTPRRLWEPGSTQTQSDGGGNILDMANMWGSSSSHASRPRADNRDAYRYQYDIYRQNEYPSYEPSPKLMRQEAAYKQISDLWPPIGSPERIQSTSPMAMDQAVPYPADRRLEPEIIDIHESQFYAKNIEPQNIESLSSTQSSPGRIKDSGIRVSSSNSSNSKDVSVNSNGPEYVTSDDTRGCFDGKKQASISQFMVPKIKQPGPANANNNISNNKNKGNLHNTSSGSASSGKENSANHRRSNLPCRQSKCKFDAATTSRCSTPTASRSTDKPASSGMQTPRPGCNTFVGGGVKSLASFHTPAPHTRGPDSSFLTMSTKSACYALQRPNSGTATPEGAKSLTVGNPQQCTSDYFQASKKPNMFLTPSLQLPVSKQKGQASASGSFEQGNPENICGNTPHPSTSLSDGNDGRNRPTVRCNPSPRSDPTSIQFLNEFNTPLMQRNINTPRPLVPQTPARLLNANLAQGTPIHAARGGGVPFTPPIRINSKPAFIKGQKNAIVYPATSTPKLGKEPSKPQLSVGPMLKHPAPQKALPGTPFVGPSASKSISLAPPQCPIDGDIPASLPMDSQFIIRR